MLNLYLRYFDLRRTSEVVERLRVSLQNAPIDFENVYLVAGDFTGLVEGASEIEAVVSKQTNGYANGKLQWSVDGSEEDEEEKGDEVDVQNDREITVEDILNDFQYNQLFEANTTSFVDVAGGGQKIDDGLNVSHAPPKHVKKSSCNILCREKLPPITDAFREAIYKTKSPWDLHKVPSATEGRLQKQRSWRTDKVTGYSNVIREGLCHMAIPRDWTWGGPASDHCPVWIEVYKRVDKEVAVAVNGGAIRGRGSVAKETMLRGVGGRATAVTSLQEAMNGVSLLAVDNPPSQTNGVVVKNGKHRLEC